ncbi:MAG: hypothetical protein H7Y88_02465, partial [Phycisphaerales bacterium]|nr:hypothetical protein [Phycisphaerales bacterium]
MLKAVLRWAIPLIALLIIGPAAGWLTGSLRSPTGSEQTTPLLAASLGAGAVALVGCFVIAAVTGAVAAAIIGPLYGLFSAGLVLAWATGQTGTIDLILRDAAPASPLMKLALEGALCAVFGVGVAWVIQQAGTGYPATPGAAAHTTHQSPLAPTSLVAIAMATAVAALIALI